MKKVLFICDICGKQLEEIEVNRKLGITGIGMIEATHRDEFTGRDTREKTIYEICSHCNKAIMEVMAKRKEEVEHQKYEDIAKGHAG